MNIFFLYFCVVLSILGSQPKLVVVKDGLSIPSTIQLADPVFKRRGEIVLLLKCGQIKLRSSVPTLQKTLLGCEGSKKYSGNSSQENGLKICNMVRGYQLLYESSLNDLFPRF